MIKQLSQARLTVAFICYAAFVHFPATAQQKTSSPPKKDIIGVLLKALHISTKPKPEDSKPVAFSFIPISTSNSGGKQVFVSSINAAFLIGKDEKTNYSSVFFLPYTDFSQNIGFGLKYNLFSPKNKWNLTGETRISNLVEYSYGLGSRSTESNRFKLNYNNFRFNFIANRKLEGFIFGGLGLSYDRYFGVSASEIPTLPGDFEKYGIGVGSSSSSSGLVFNLLHDNRKNSINPADGLYIQTVLRVNPGWLANDNLWSSLYVDGRRYFKLDGPKRKIIAVSAFYWGSFGNVPYFGLPGTELELSGRSGRGYSAARFRGRHMFYLEGEYRFDISRNGLFGAVGFINFQSFTDSNNRISGINPAVGAGARIKFNKSSDTNLAIDFGFGKDSFGIYIGLGEFF
jgi:hypothetical protein